MLLSIVFPAATSRSEEQHSKIPLRRCIAELAENSGGTRSWRCSRAADAVEPGRLTLLRFTEQASAETELNEAVLIRPELSGCEAAAPLTTAAGEPSRWMRGYAEAIRNELESRKSAQGQYPSPLLMLDIRGSCDSRVPARMEMFTQLLMAMGVDPRMIFNTFDSAEAVRASSDIEPLATALSSDPRVSIYEVTEKMLSERSLCARPDESDHGFVAFLFEVLLERSPTTAESAMWERHLSTGLSRTKLASGVLSGVGVGSGVHAWSADIRALRLEALRSMVLRWYREILLRPAGAHEDIYVERWVNWLAAGASPNVVRARILSSVELYQQAGNNDEGFLRAALGRVAGAATAQLPVAPFMKELTQLRLHSAASAEPEIRNQIAYFIVQSPYSARWAAYQAFSECRRLRVQRFREQPYSSGWAYLGANIYEPLLSLNLPHPDSAIAFDPGGWIGFVQALDLLRSNPASRYVILDGSE